MDASALSLSGYQRSARSLAAKASLPLAAAAAATVLPASAHAGVVVTQFSSGNVASLGVDNLYIDLDGGRISTGAISGGDFQIIVGTTDGGRGDNLYSRLFVDQGFIATYPTNFNQYVPRSLAVSTPVDGALFDQGKYTNTFFNNYAGSYADVNPIWQSGTGYIGVKFADGDGYNHYGWLKVATNADATSITLLAMGYNDAVDGPISAGEGLSSVPEPATSATLLALGAAGLVAYRRRKHFRRSV
ncbi:MAG: PEP-CTERM sorting domain-containing protein [Verrucomicrobia bacterium]|nr:PEP-CTERM sorting domain-containing protein [Verrucomicrobiota bacterium]